LGAFSFHETKNYVCGEGGGLCINTPELIERAEILREKGTNRSRFLRGMVDKYTWVDVGSSHVPSELSCAFLMAQLEQLEAIAERRREIYEFYHEHLAPLARRGRLELPTIPPGCQSNYHMFYVLVSDITERDALIAHLKDHGIGAVFHYVPLHASPVGARLGYRLGDLPVTEERSARLVRLPFYNDISQVEQMEVVAHVRNFAARSVARRAAA
jgi:dTDP-4-amino-4,6-dideoxygalactose transaminase